MDVDVKGEAFEGLLEKLPAKARKARANTSRLARSSRPSSR